MEQTIDEWFDSLHKVNSSDNPRLADRTSACVLLVANGVPCYIWSEDVLAYYGVPTEVFTICIVVENVQHAAEILMENGWLHAPRELQPRTYDIKRTSDKLLDSQIFTLHRIGPKWDSVISLQATSMWNIHLPASLHEHLRSQWSFIPTLPIFLDALIETWLNTLDEEYRFRLRVDVWLGYLYRYVSILRQPDFGLRLQKEHRQYHYDVIAGTILSGNEFWRVEKQVRNDIRDGKLEPHFDKNCKSQCTKCQPGSSTQPT